MNGFLKNSAQAADPPAAPKTATKAKKDFFFEGEWVQDRLASLAEARADSTPDKHIPTWIYIYIYICIHVYMKTMVHSDAYVDIYV